MNDRTLLRIAWDYPLPAEAWPFLLESVGRHPLVLFGAAAGLVPSLAVPAFRPDEADVIYGHPDPNLLLSASNLRWVELGSAGYTPYDNEALRNSFRQRGVMFTNSSRVYDEPCAQHLAAMILSLSRDLPGCLDNQRGERGWPNHHGRSQRTRLLNGQTVLIYGFGAIARRLVEILTPLHMRLVGVRRTVRGDEGIPMATEAEADALLGETDHVVNILPETEATRRYFDGGRFARFKAGARFYNIGRGATVDQDALLAVLADRTKLDAAFLDVTDPEPLPPAHGLWSAPNCYITPHFGGGHSVEARRLTEHFLANLRAFEEKRELLDRVY